MTLCREIDTTLGWFPVSGLLRFAPWTHSVRAPGREASGEAGACGPWMDGCGTGPSGGRAPAGRGWTEGLPSLRERWSDRGRRPGALERSGTPSGSTGAIGAAVRERCGDRGCRPGALGRSGTPSGSTGAVGAAVRERWSDRGRRPGALERSGTPSGSVGAIGDAVRERWGDRGRRPGALGRSGLPSPTLPLSHAPTLPFAHAPSPPRPSCSYPLAALAASA